MVFDPLPRFRQLKTVPFGHEVISGAEWGVPGVDLVCFGADRVGADDSAVALMARWRGENQHGFPRQGQTVTIDGTRAWAQAQLIERPDRILFLVRDGDRGFVGQMGLSSVALSDRSAEYDNIVRGDKAARPGVMVDASRVLLGWAYDRLGFESLWLKVFWDNFRAVALYHRIGFVPVRLHPIVRREQDGVTDWIDAPPGGAFERFHMTMVHRPGVAG